MIYIRMIGCVLIAYLGYTQISDHLASAFSESPIIKVDGILNMWASYGLCFIFSYLAIYYIKAKYELAWRIGEINRVLIFCSIVVAPLLAIGTYIQAKDNVSNYIECSELRKFSSRYSSRTYATSTELCQQLSQDK